MRAESVLFITDKICHNGDSKGDRKKRIQWLPLQIILKGPPPKMKSVIYCKPTSQGIHTFYLSVNGQDYYLFRQDFRRGVHHFFRDGVSVDKALDFKKAHQDTAIMRTMQKLPSYIKYIEKCHGIQVLRATIKRNEIIFLF